MERVKVQILHYETGEQIAAFGWTNRDVTAEATESLLVLMTTTEPDGFVVDEHGDKIAIAAFTRVSDGKHTSTSVTYYKGVKDFIESWLRDYLD